MFNLELNPVAELHDDFLCFEGVITVGDFSEGFLASASLWDAARYKRQWQAAALRLLETRDRTAFVTSFVHPDADHNVIWSAWCVGSHVYVQNRLLLRDLIPGVLDVEHIERFVDDRRTTTDEGGTISEWSITLADIAKFAA